MIKRIVLIFVCGLVFCDCYSQIAPPIQWQNTIGGSGIDYPYSIQQTSDKGYILGGYSSSNISGDKTENSLGGYDIWIVKLDSSGTIQWQNTIGGNDNDHLSSIQQTANGNYILGGYSGSNVSGDKSENSIGAYDYWIVDINAQGIINWQNTIGGSSDDFLISIQQTFDGGFILGGWSTSNISGDKTENSMGLSDYWLIKADSLGQIEWQNTIGGSGSDWLTSIEQCSDMGYILGGYSDSGMSGDKTEISVGNTWSYDYWVIKLDNSGNIQWQNTIGGYDADMLNSIKETDDKGYILGGSSSSNLSGDKTENNLGLTDYWVIKIDSTGIIQWQNTIGGNSSDDLSSLNKTKDGGYILGGTSASYISGDKTENNLGIIDFWTVKLDFAGNILWQNTIGGSDYDNLHAISQAQDFGYILAGYSNSNISSDKTENCLGSYDYWVVKLAPDTITSVPNLQSSPFNLQLFPNPATGNIQLTINTKHNAPLHCEIINVMGEAVFKSQILNPKSQIRMDVSFLAKGIYVVRVGDGKSFENKKLVVE